MRWCALWTACLDLIFPPRCVAAGCGAPGRWLCPDCVARIGALPSPRCPRCGDATAAPGPCRECRADPPPFRRAVAAGVYAGPLRDAIHALKYRGAVAVAPALAGLAADALRVTGLAADACVVPVPSHPNRVAGRGVDHSRRADAVAHALALPLAGGVLVRARDTRPQVGLTPAERHANVAGAFEMVRRLECGTAIVVDDVMTTGATARACAAAVRAAGVRRVEVCTVARAISHGAD